jgi:hypothetical protein
VNNFFFTEFAVELVPTFGLGSGLGLELGFGLTIFSLLRMLFD